MGMAQRVEKASQVFIRNDSECGGGRPGSPPRKMQKGDGGQAKFSIRNDAEGGGGRSDSPLGTTQKCQ